MCNLLNSGYRARGCQGTGLVVAGELDEVVLQHPHEDGGEEASEKQHRHARVDDAEPVDLRCREAQGSGLAGIEAGWLRRWKEDARVDEV